MTKKEAIRKLKRELEELDGDWRFKEIAEALDMAIEALQEQSRDCMWVCHNCRLDVHVTTTGASDAEKGENHERI